MEWERTQRAVANNSLKPLRQWIWRYIKEAEESNQERSKEGFFRRSEN